MHLSGGIALLALVPEPSKLVAKIFFTRVNNDLLVLIWNIGIFNLRWSNNLNNVFQNLAS